MSANTTASGVSGRYATALFELARDSGELDAISGDLDQLEAALRDSDDFSALVASPVYSREQQSAVVGALADRMGVARKTRNFLLLLAQKGRLYVLGDAVRDFKSLARAHRGVVEARVSSARPLSDSQRAALKSSLQAAAGGEILLNETVDESLLGGLVVQLGSKMLDASLRNRLDQVQTAMKEATL